MNFRDGLPMDVDYDLNGQLIGEYANGTMITEYKGDRFTQDDVVCS